MYGFGTSTRANREKVFVSHEHSLLADSETRSPGPATYEQRPSIGPQVNGALESSPAILSSSEAGRLVFDAGGPEAEARIASAFETWTDGSVAVGRVRCRNFGGA